LDKIAEMVNAGYKQSEIGEKLGISQQMVSYRISVIKTKYPDLLNAPGRTKDFTNDTNTLQKYKSEGAKSFVEIPEEPIVDYTKPYRF
jgi:predicted transcriptional regulator